MGNLISNYIDEILDIYYSKTIGYLPATDKYYEAKAVVGHLHDNGFDKYEMQTILKLMNGNICFDNLPDSLWDISIVEKGKFYYHKDLHIVSEASSLCTLTMKVMHRPFFLEMKIVYTIDHILDYYYRNIKVPDDLKNYKRDHAAIKKMLQDYSKMEEFSNVDFVLVMIDSYSLEENPSYNVFDIAKYRKEAYDYLNFQQLMAKSEGTNKIQWRRGSDM